MKMTTMRRKIMRFSLRLVGIVKMIVVPGSRIEEVAANVIEFYVPNNCRKPLKWVPEFHRGKIIEFCPQTKKSAERLVFLEDRHEFDRCFQS
jgi:hypothetical protein